MSDQFTVKIDHKPNPPKQIPDSVHIPQPPRSKKPTKKQLAVFFVAVIVISVVGIVGFQLLGNSKTNQGSNAEVAAETAQVVERVGKLIALPEGETPTLATVTDPAQLQGQPFFANAKEGFQVLLYPVAQKAFLYDPERNIIVEVATLNLGQ